ncbi:hypothetical protein ACTPD5_22450, partial [Clostridioides difficile]
MLIVKDINKSKKFYEDVMEQKITLDLGEHVSFENGFGELPYISIIILSIIVIGSVFSSFIMTHEPTYMDLASSNLAPNK